MYTQMNKQVNGSAPSKEIIIEEPPEDVVHAPEMNASGTSMENREYQVFVPVAMANNKEIPPNVEEEEEVEDDFDKRLAEINVQMRRSLTEERSTGVTGVARHSINPKDSNQNDVDSNKRNTGQASANTRGSAHTKEVGRNKDVEDLSYTEHSSVVNEMSAEESNSVTEHGQEDQISKKPGWMVDSRKAIQRLTNEPFAMDFANLGNTDDAALRECLMKHGDLSTIYRNISTLSHPKKVVEQVQMLMINCSAASVDNRRRVCRQVEQVMQWLEENMRPIIVAFDSIANQYNTRRQSNYRGTAASELPATSSRSLRHQSQGRATRPDIRTRNPRRVLNSSMEESDEEERLSEAFTPCSLLIEDGNASDCNDPQSNRDEMPGNKKRGRPKGKSRKCLSSSSSPTQQRRSARPIQLSSDSEEIYESRELGRRNAYRSSRKDRRSSRYSLRSNHVIHITSTEDESSEHDSRKASRSGRQIKKPMHLINTPVPRISQRRQPPAVISKNMDSRRSFDSDEEGEIACSEPEAKRSRKQELLSVREETNTPATPTAEISSHACVCKMEFSSGEEFERHRKLTGHMVRDRETTLAEQAGSETNEDPAPDIKPMLNDLFADSRSSQKRSPPKKVTGHSGESHGVLNLKESLEDVVGTPGLVQPNYIFLTWSENFSLDLALAVARSANNNILIVKRFPPAAMADISRLCNYFQTSVVEVGPNSNAIRLFSFGGMPFPQMITNKAKFESLAELQAEFKKFADSKGKGLVNILKHAQNNRDWYDSLRLDFKEDAIFTDTV